VRETGTLSLPDAVHKMTGLPADRLGLVDRGIVASGMVADLVAFDPGTVADRATFTEPRQRPAGVRWTIVAGIPVLADGLLQPARPGRFLRHG
jgi:N-acyl-D-aspartate/D-glutamate deacylase